MKSLMTCVCALFSLALVLRAAEAPDVSKLSEADRKQVGEWLSQRAEAMIEAHRLQGEVQAAAFDPACSTPAVEELRARVRDLQAEIEKVRREIQVKVLEVPAVREKARKIDELKAKEQELDKKISEKLEK